MKKSLSQKISPEPAHAGPDIEGFMTRIEQKLFLLDKKVDALMAQNSARPAAARNNDPRPGHRPDAARRPNDPRQQQQLHGNRDERREGHRERVLHKAVCADCNSGCEVPFKPTGERPVYCKSCFSKRKSGGAAKIVRPDLDRRPVAVFQAPAANTSVLEAPAPAVSAREVPKKKKAAKQAKKAKR